MPAKYAILISFLIFLLPTSLVAEQPVIIPGEIPANVLGGRAAQMAITVKGAPAGSVLSLTVPEGFKAEPSSVTIPARQGEYLWTPKLTPPSRNTVLEKGRIWIELTLQEAGKPIQLLDRRSLLFDYHPGVDLRSFILLGLLGIAIGYLVRLFIKILSEVPTPSPSPVAGEQSPGPLTRFVQRHYYSVDFSVTLVIGFLALVTMIADGRPPQNASWWYSALAVGVGLGLLTNSELVVKIRR